jgi:hypothetical protein
LHRFEPAGTGQSIPPCSPDHFPNKGLRFPKSQEKPPFQTRDAIERIIARGGLDESERKALWDGLFLGVAEVAEFLAHVRTHSAHPWIYPMVFAAAHTGMRRSELLRLRVCPDTPFGIIHEITATPIIYAINNSVPMGISRPHFASPATFGFQAIKATYEMENSIPLNKIQNRSSGAWELLGLGRSYLRLAEWVRPFAQTVVGVFRRGGRHCRHARARVRHTGFGSDDDSASGWACLSLSKSRP